MLDKMGRGAILPAMPAPIFTANADYTVIDRSPLVLEAGAPVRLGPSDRVWPGWVSVVQDDGRSTYVPSASVEVQEAGAGVMKQRFDATDLSVRKGEMIVSLIKQDGWHWARGADGQEGWVPGYLLDPA